MKVAIKSRDRYQLDYNITEFKKEKLEDTDMDLVKAEKILKELLVKDSKFFEDTLLRGHIFYTVYQYYTLVILARVEFSVLSKNCISYFLPTLNFNNIKKIIFLNTLLPSGISC